MLHIFNPLHFPKLVRIGEVNFKAWSDSASETTVYKLDWSQTEKNKKEHFYKWIKNSKTTFTCSPTEFVGDLPKEYDEWLKNFTFAIPVHYLERIRDFSRRGQETWTARYPFDTSIRELCYKPAISYIEVAFKLIADCIYDSETNYFYRGDDKVIVAHAALYKFWCFQTGRGLIEDHADFERLEFIANFEGYGDERPVGDTALKITVKKFLNAIKEHNKVLDEAHRMSMEDSGPVVGPSLGETISCQECMNRNTGTATIGYKDCKKGYGYNSDNCKKDRASLGKSTNS